MDDHDNSMSAVLAECQESAKVGYKIAHEQEKNLRQALSVAEEKVKSALLDFDSSLCRSPETTGLLEQQLRDIHQEFSKLSTAFRDDLENLRGNMSKFSITLFGRTMAGKSTLMEILTEGNGETIGKGAQRTTRDVRRYAWNGLEVTDVPGISAFGGEEDEQIAFHAAKTADLILFLLTDDAPQADEADWFSRMISLGKPVMCIMNVKVAVQEGKSVKLAERDIQKKFDMGRLENIRKQFLEYAKQYEQTWEHIPFIFVHLKSAYLAQQTTSPDKAEMYYQLSRIEGLKKRIIEEVKTKGNFFRLRNFIDIISDPVLDSLEDLLSQSQLNSVQGRTILSKKEQLDHWKETFYRDSRAQINSLTTRIESDLRFEIAAFAEEHFDDKNADKAWNRLLRERQVDLQCQEMLENFESKVNNMLKEISREIENELKFSASFADDKALRMSPVIDGKRVWNWSFIIAEGGIGVASMTASMIASFAASAATRAAAKAAAGPLGVAFMVVTGVNFLGSLFFKSREKKEREARVQLERNLRENVSKICASLRSQMVKALDSLISVKIGALLEEMDKIDSVIFRLADTQRELAWGLDEHLLQLNGQLLTEAIRLIGAEGLERHIQSVARIPGNSNLIMLRDGVVFPEEECNKLRESMSEGIHFVYETENKQILISSILGASIDKSQIEIDEKIGVAHIPLKNPTPNMLNRVRLAQQLSGIQIIDQ